MDAVCHSLVQGRAKRVTRKGSWLKPIFFIVTLNIGKKSEVWRKLNFMFSKILLSRRGVSTPLSNPGEGGISNPGMGTPGYIFYEI